MPTEGLAQKQLSQHKSVQFHEFLATSDPFAVHWGSHLQAALFFYTVFVVTIILCLWHKSRCKYSCWFIVASAEHFGIICERSIRDIQYFLHDVNILFSISEIWVGFFLSCDRMVPTVPILNIYLDISESGNPWPLWESCIYRDPCHFVGILRTIRLHHVADLSQTFIQPKDGTSRKPDSNIEGHPGFGFDSRPNPQVIILPTQTNGAIRSEMIRDGCFSFPKWCFSLNRAQKNQEPAQKKSWHLYQVWSPQKWMAFDII